MKKIAQIILVFAVILTSVQFSIAQLGSTYLEGYGKAKWGMSKEKVMQCYPNRTFGAVSREYEAEGLWLDSIIVEEQANLFFLFSEDKLFEVIVDVKVGTFNKDACVRIFDKLEKLLIKRYRRPKTRDKSNYFVEWKTFESTIWLILSEEDKPGFTLQIQYLCTELYDKYRKRVGSDL